MAELETALLARLMAARNAQLGPAGQAFVEEQGRFLTPDTGAPSPPGDQKQYVRDQALLSADEFMRKWGHMPGQGRLR